MELFSGTKSISDAFRYAGFGVFTVDYDPRFNPSLCADISELSAETVLERFGRPDVIWASPDCTAFSIASVSHNWTAAEDGYMPKREFAARSLRLLKHTIRLIDKLDPPLFFIENPRGMMRKMPVMQAFARYTVTYCQYGDNRMKPTDIWTNHPCPQFKPMCKRGDPCHEAAPRGSKTGTQGLKNSVERARIPRLLCEHIAEISKQYLKEGEDANG